MDKTSIGIIGGGFVGQVLKRYYENASIYDINGRFDSLEEALNKKIVFIAFNLADNAASEESRKTLADYMVAMKKPELVITKSTFVPGTTDYLQSLRPDIPVMYNVELLTEMTAWEDFTEPVFQILGCTHRSLPLALEVFGILPHAPVRRIISPLDAETLKHAINSYYGMKVVFFNELYDGCRKIGADYETVREIMMQDPRISQSHSVIWHKGYRGFGGKCLPKDLAALNKIIKSPLLTMVEEINSKLVELKQ